MDKLEKALFFIVTLSSSTKDWTTKAEKTKIGILILDLKYKIKRKLRVWELHGDHS